MDDLLRRARDWGVEPGYTSATGEVVEAPPATIEAILAALGAGDGDRPQPPGPLVVHPGEARPVAAPAVLRTEDGRELAVADRLPADLPLGYHELHPDSGGPVQRVIVSPGTIAGPPPGRSWGWAVQLYGLRSAASWGMGDLRDLADLAAWAGTELGSSFVLVNPLHAALPGEPQEPSPYFPSSRRYRSPLYLRIEDVPGAADLPGLDGLARAGRALNAGRLVDRDAVWRLKSAALEDLWARGVDSPELEAWRRAEGGGLEAYATFCALSEELGRPWSAWPAPYRHPGQPAVAEFRRQKADRVRFHAWVQWLLHRQLSQVEADHVVIHDLAVGCDPAGADAWSDQDVLVFDLSVGAPPDEFNRLGQDWGAPPFDPWRLRAAGYQPFVDIVRGSLRAGGGIRLDHVMGLFRLYWLPRGDGPARGTYVRYPADDLLDIVALESHRAGGFVVGEDLGTVEPGVRETLLERGMLSYRLLWFDPDPADWPEQALGAVTTHDLPTVAGLWTGSDLRVQHEAGVRPNEEAAAAVREQIQAAGHLAPDAPVDEVVRAVHEVLSSAPSRLLAATLDDALGVEERPNLPGTTDQWPNWRLALPSPLEEIRSHPGPAQVAAALARRS